MWKFCEIKPQYKNGVSRKKEKLGKFAVVITVPAKKKMAEMEPIHSASADTGDETYTGLANVIAEPPAPFSMFEYESEPVQTQIRTVWVY